MDSTLPPSSFFLSQNLSQTAKKRKRKNFLDSEKKKKKSYFPSLVKFLGKSSSKESQIISSPMRRSSTPWTLSLPLYCYHPVLSIFPASFPSDILHPFLFLDRKFRPKLTHFSFLFFSFFFSSFPFPTFPILPRLSNWFSFLPSNRKFQNYHQFKKILYLAFLPHSTFSWIEIS